MRVFNYNNTIINCDDADPQLSKVIGSGAEELDINLFGDKASYANSLNTVKVDGVWTFDSASVDATIALANAAELSRQEDALIKLTQDKATAESLGLTSKAGEIQVSIDTVNARIVELTP